MKTSSLGYLIKEGFRNTLANRFMSLASVGVLTACLLLIGGAVLLTMNVNSIVGYVENQNEVLVFVEEALSDSDIPQMQAQLEGNANIHTVTYLSKADVLEQQKALMQDKADLLQSFEDDNPFPRTFILKIDDLSRLNSTLEEVQQLDGVEGISASADLAATITDIKRGISFAGSYIVIIMSIVSLVIVANTIKITVFSRRKEINIMKYVGATNTFIRLPFLIEGVFLGILSALFAFLLLWGGYTYVIQWVSETPSSWFQMAYANLVDFKDVGTNLFLAFLGAGVGIGAIGSMAFIRKFLKV